MNRRFKNNLVFSNLQRGKWGQEAVGRISVNRCGKSTILKLRARTIYLKQGKLESQACLQPD
mgnify:FL=1